MLSEKKNSFKKLEYKATSSSTAWIRLKKCKISKIIKGCKEKFFINQIFNENIRRLHQGKKFFGKKMQVNFFAKNCAEFFFLQGKHFFAEKLFSLMKTSDIFVKNLVNKKLLSFDLST